MKGYVYLDWDGNLVYKTYDVIKFEMPTFWQDNAELIQKSWEFDTTQETMMRAMFRGIQQMKVKPVRITMLADTIGYDLSGYSLLAQSERNPAIDPPKDTTGKGNPF